MRAVAVFALLVSAALAGPPAVASEPFHGKRVVNRTFDVPAGDLCDFAYHTEITIAQNIKIFSDENGDVIGTEDQLHASVLHVNADTGTALTERVHYTVHVDFLAGTYRVNGNTWHLRDADGQVVLVAGGLYVVDIFTFELLRETPNVNSDLAATICPALGGEAVVQHRHARRARGRWFDESGDDVAPRPVRDPTGRATNPSAVAAFRRNRLLSPAPFPTFAASADERASLPQRHHARLPEPVEIVSDSGHLHQTPVIICDELDQSPRQTPARRGNESPAVARVGASPGSTSRKDRLSNWKRVPPSWAMCLWSPTCHGEEIPQARSAPAPGP